MKTPLQPNNEVELQLLARLRAGDESAFEALLNDLYEPMKRLAIIYVNDSRIAEEVVQDTWIGVLRGLAKFEGRSSLKTWIFSILINRAKTYAQREGRYVQMDDYAPDDDNEPTVDPSHFFPPDHEQYGGEWLIQPADWETIPEARLVSQETLAYIQKAIDNLPPIQRQVITLRDVQQWNAQEVCNLLNITETNQRVLLHRARAKVRQALEEYFKQT